MAIADNTPIPTPTGWILARDLRLTDYVFGMDGQPKKIISIQNYTPTQCYVAEMTDHTGLIGDRHLTFPTQDKTERMRQFDWDMCAKRKSNRIKVFTPKCKPMSVVDLITTGLRDNIDGRRALSVPTTAPLAMDTCGW